MLPFLNFVADQQEHSLRETMDALADEFGLTPQERKELLTSRRQATFDNRVGWVRTYSKKTELFKFTRQGYYRIAEKGLQILTGKYSAISANFLA